MKKQRLGVLDIINMVLCCLLTAASVLFLFLSTCGAEMHCHQANRIAAIGGAVLLILSILSSLLKGKTGAVFSFICAAAAAVEALIPGTIAGLCMMPEMFCRSVMKPCVILFAVVICVISLIDGILKVKKSSK